jgi:hypothetical protein
MPFTRMDVDRFGAEVAHSGVQSRRCVQLERARLPDDLFCRRLTAIRAYLLAGMARSRGGGRTSDSCWRVAELDAGREDRARPKHDPE